MCPYMCLTRAAGKQLVCQSCACVIAAALNLKSLDRCSSLMSLVFDVSGDAMRNVQGICFLQDLEQVVDCQASPAPAPVPAAPLSPTLPRSLSPSFPSFLPPSRTNLSLVLYSQHRNKKIKNSKPLPLWPSGLPFHRAPTLLHPSLRAFNTFQTKPCDASYPPQLSCQVCNRDKVEKGRDRTLPPFRQGG